MLEKDADRVALRPAGADDADLLFEIHRAAMKAYVDAVWGWDDAWQRSFFRDHFEVANLQVVLLEEQMIGSLEVIQHAEDIELRSISLLPAYQGSGIGSNLIRGIMAEAAEKKLPVRLQVLQVNTAARHLYERLGFAVKGSTETHFQMEWA